MSEIERPNILAVYDYYGLRVIGRNGEWRKAQCPRLDHEDIDPSASVNEELGKWNCFSCGHSGDGLDVIREREDLVGWAELVRFAEKHFGGSGVGVRGGRSSGGRVPGGKGNHRGGGNWVPPWSLS